MAKGIGAASDFYRVRTMHYDLLDSPDFEWRDDVLYRRPPAVVPSERESFLVQAVALDDDENVTVLGVFDNAADAHEALSTASEDLGVLTRAEFEDRYFPAGA